MRVMNRGADAASTVEVPAANLVDLGNWHNVMGQRFMSLSEFQVTAADLTNEQSIRALANAGDGKDLLSRLGRALSACTPALHPNSAILSPEDPTIYCMGAACFSIKIAEGVYGAGESYVIGPEVAALLSRDLNFLFGTVDGAIEVSDAVAKKLEELGPKGEHGIPAEFNAEETGEVLTVAQHYWVVPEASASHETMLEYAKGLVTDFCPRAAALLDSVGISMDEAQHYPPGSVPRVLADIDQLSRLLSLTLQTMPDADTVISHVGGYLQSALMIAKIRAFQ
jgi:hypothetical protein